MLLIVFAAPNLGFAAVGGDALMGAGNCDPSEGDWLATKFSEEYPNTSPNTGSNVPLTAIGCSGTYCDYMQVKESRDFLLSSIYGRGDDYSDSSTPMIEQGPSKGHFDTTTSPQFMQCGGNEFVKQITCHYEFCGSLSITCHSVYATKSATPDPEESAIELFGPVVMSFYEDDCLGETTCPDGYVIVGLGCRQLAYDKSHHCQQPFLYCKQARIREAEVDRVTVTKATWSYEYVGNQEVEMDMTIVLSSALTQTQGQTDTTTSEKVDSLQYGASISAGYGPVEASASVEKGTSSSSSHSLTKQLERAMTTGSEKTTEIVQKLDPKKDCCPTTDTGCGETIPVYYQLVWTLFDSFGGKSTIKTNDYLCSNGVAGAPRCLPRDCWSVSAVDQGDIGPGCQCCKPDSIVYEGITHLSEDGIKDVNGKSCGLI